MRSKGLKNIDIFEEDYIFLTTFKKSDKDFNNIADVVNEVIRGYYYCVIEKQIPIPLDENNRIIVKDFNKK